MKVGMGSSNVIVYHVCTLVAESPFCGYLETSQALRVRSQESTMLTFAWHTALSKRRSKAKLRSWGSALLSWGASCFPAALFACLPFAGVCAVL